MAQYNGFQCDSCGDIVSTEERIKVTTKFESNVRDDEGRLIQGEYYLDKCINCIVLPAVELKPLRRRKRAEGVQDPSAA